MSKRFNQFLILGCLSIAAPCYGVPGIVGGEKAIDRIAFGSCSKQNASGREQPIWSKVVAEKPDLFLFMGDNVYADTKDMGKMRERYQRLAKQPGYQKLRAACEVMATWDDHDYGEDDAGADYPMREGAQKEFLDFFDFPKGAPQRSRPGIYSAKIFGEEGKRVQVVMLDTRYFRSELIDNPELLKGRSPHYLPNRDPKATVLGDAQWRWLEEQLGKPAELRVIVSSIQVIPEEHFYEKWSNFPLERERLMRLLRKSGAGGVVLLSGDRHLAEISRVGADDASGIGYPLSEITSSGLIMGSGGGGEPNRYRSSPSIYRKPNYGLLSIDWDAPGGAVVTASIRGREGEVVFDSALKLADLEPSR